MNDEKGIWSAYTAKEHEQGAPYLMKSQPVTTPLGKMSDEELLAISRQIHSAELIRRHNQSVGDDMFQNKERVEYIDQVNDELARRNLSTNSPLDLTQPDQREAD